MLRERHSDGPPLPPSRRAQMLLGRAAAAPQPATRWQHQIQTKGRFRPLADEEANRLLGIRADDEDQDQERSDSDLEDWRRNAQMLSERDEMLLLTGGRGRDALDVAPVNRRKLHATDHRRRSPQTPTTIETTSSRQSPEAVEPARARRTIFSLAKRSQDTKKPAKQEKSRAKIRSRHKFGPLLDEDGDRDDVDAHEIGPDEDQAHEDADDNSSMSFAQSGCHSILSAWRLKAAKRRARQLVQQPAKGPGSSGAPRPRSVLSNSSSVGRKSLASTAYTLGSRLGHSGAASSSRIPLGPKSAQHFVTNSRRRRRANELILSTLEARRRAISLNRQNVLAAGSLFGSESYLGGAGGGVTPLDDYQRLSLSPSPGAKSALRRSPYEDAGQLAAVAELTRRTALSDLGGRQSPAVEAQRSKLLLMSTAAHAKQQQRPIQALRLVGEKSAGGQRAPPLAKLDQNSSDLCSSNESSSGAESKEESSGGGDSSSSGSQFTQLVTSELTPSRMLMGDLHDDELRTRINPSRGDYHRNRVVQATARASSPRVGSPAASKPRQQLGASRDAAQKLQATRATAAATERRRSPQQVVAHVNQIQKPSGKVDKENQRRSKQQVSTTTASEDDDKVGKLRRGALKRDSIRRLRLSQKQRESQVVDGSSSSNDYDQHQVSRSRPGSSRLASSRDQRHDQTDQTDQQQQQQQSLRPLSKARKLDIESNPFLNRHHFRTMSARSTESRQSFAGSQRSRASPVGPPRQTNVTDQQSERVRSPQLEARSRPSMSPPPPPLPSKNQATTNRREAHESDRLQMPRIDLENLRQAEQLIKELQGTKPPPVVTRRNVEPLAGRQVKSLSLEAPAPPRRRSREKPQPGRGEESMSGTDHRNVFKTTTRLVHEGARSSDSLKSDFRGSSQQVELLEKWRHEQQPPVRRPDGSTFSEQKFSSERIEMRRSRERLGGSTRPRSISPPPEFSDNPDSKPHRQPAAARHSAGGDVMPREPQPTSHAQPKTPPRPRPAPAASVPSNDARQNSQHVERIESTAATAAPTESSQRKPSDRSTAARLPKFERTADDEFRKRVDQLRQIARANLEASEARQKQEASAARRRELVRPLSTNWDGPKSETGREPEANLAPESNRRLLSTSLRSAPASTNLDEMLLADRYQRPLTAARPTAGHATTPVGVWRRSNSSLASLGSSARAAPAASTAMTPAARRPLSPSLGTSLLSQSTISATSSQIEAPVRVIVRERSAPQLDFAQVEKRPAAQQSSFAESPPTPARPQQSASKSTMGARLKSTSPGESGPTAARPLGDRPIGTLMESQAATATSGGSLTSRVPSSTTSGIRAVQQRSSEFGRPTSSNDDSAISSSVSSPSAPSFATNNPMGSGMQRSGFGATTPSSAESTQSSRGPETTSESVRTADLQASPQFIQSILRRQQTSGVADTQAGGSPLSLAQPAHHHSSTIISTQLQAGDVSAPPMRQASAMEARQLSSPAPTQQLLGLGSSSHAELIQPAAGPTKRVHFNDRTSVRSFESISSTNSNTTAIAQHQQSDLDDFGARQQVGSPDSMGSGSTSRLSCESPAFGESRRPGGAAAIYAVRGDPDLELAGQSGQLSGLPASRHLPQPQAAEQVHQRSRLSQTLYGQSQQALGAGGQLQSMLQSPVGQARVQPFAPQLPVQSMQPPAPVLGAIRMTAPSAISTGQIQLSPRQHQALLVPGQQMHLTPQVYNQQPPPQFRTQQFAGQLQQLGVGRLPQEAATVNLDEEDPDYALRLRQAATRRAFNFRQQPGGPQHVQQVASGHQQLHGEQLLADNRSQNSEARGRQHAAASANLANFHTEV